MGSLAPAVDGNETGVARDVIRRSTAPNGRAVSRVAWRPSERITFSRWVQDGRKLGQLGRSVGWWIGDWLRYGNTAYGERYARAARITGYDPQTLMNMVYVASRFEESRRRENLSWSHHAEVAALDEDTQERLLMFAESERLSVRCLREEMRRARRSVKAGKEGRPSEAAQIEASTPAESGDVVVCPECGSAFSATTGPD